MPAELFVTPAGDRRTRSRQSSLVVVSLVVHAGLVLALIIVSILLPDVLPSPHTSALAWDAGPQMVRLVDIALPPPPPTRTLPIAPPASADAAPVVAPEGIAPEPERSPAVPVDPGLQPGLVQGNPSDAAIVAPPPPPPPGPAAPSQPVRLHEGIDAPRKVKDVTPLYPALARSAGAQGVVILEAIIDIQGNVVSTRILRSIPLLDEAAVNAVQQWKYTPARLNGEPVPVVVTVTVNFTLGR
jgi:protein TonB